MKIKWIGINVLMGIQKPKILTKDEIAFLRQTVAIRDNYKCILCGKPAVDIAHIAPRSRGVKDSALIWQKKNLVCSCRDCHIETKAQRRKFLERMMELYGYEYPEPIFKNYLEG